MTGLYEPSLKLFFWFPVICRTDPSSKVSAFLPSLNTFFHERELVGVLKMLSDELRISHAAHSPSQQGIP
jgi:hypothetical protein